jgi:hypothetical protein
MRWTLFPFAILVLFVPSLAAAQPDLATLQQSYRTVLDQERQASQLGAAHSHPGKPDASPQQSAS